MAKSLAKAADRLKRRRRCRRGRPSAAVLITDRHRLPDPAAAARGLPRGAIVIVRDYDAPDRAALAAALCRVRRARGLKLLIAGDSALAARLGADGVHFPEGLMRRAPETRRRHPGWLITAATHDLAAIRRAEALRLDAVLVAPVFATRSHPGAQAIGPNRLGAWARSTKLPVYALGGVNAASARRLIGGGAHGLAAIDGWR